MTRNERLTSMLQDVALVFGLYLALVLSGAKLEAWQWVIIVVALLLAIAKSTVNGIKHGVHHSIGQLAHMSPEDRAKIYKEHMDHCPGIVKE